ncbi:MAG TPA: glycosyltransferase [Deltaproteobacteria bacterium]|nr:glycosyltransferase [Deltaproteobacteria bacterium]
MKIIFIGGRDIHTIGGIESYMYNLATCLKNNGYEPVVFCESDRNEVEYVNGFKVVHNKSIGGRYLCKILLGHKATAYALFKEREAKIYHYNAWPPTMASWLAAIIGKKPIFQGHGFGWKRTKYSPRQQKIMKVMEWLVVKIMKNITAVSQEQTDYFLTHYGKKCVTIPTAVNLPDDNYESNILENFKLEAEGYYLYLGRLVQDKNPDYLIKAFNKSGIQGKKLVIAGSNDADSQYVEYLHQLSAENPSVIFTGAVYGNDKEMLLSKCFAFCLPSTLEGLPITLLEAMSHKRICLASNIPANKEALGDSGVWVQYEDVDDLCDKMLYILKNHKDLEIQKKANYRRVVENFTWDRVTDLYIKYIKSLD